jgi:predicted nuclease of restriction endonuclease-like (RecB) superfamily
MEQLILGKEYLHLLAEIKSKIKSAQVRAALAVNDEVIKLYWEIGKSILEKEPKWGSKFLSKLSKDLQLALPDTQGYSVRNLERMRQLARMYPDFKIIATQAVSQLPWGHILVLIQKIKDYDERHWYVQQTIQNGWARDELALEIKNTLYQRQAISSNKTSNFLQRLPAPQSGLAHDLLKSPYNFDFLGLLPSAHEKEIEHASVQHIVKFLLELGKGFAFVGTQVPIEVDGNEYFIDMLFYNLKLHCYMVCEIKATKFRPEHAGQLNFYLNVVDDHYKTPTDNPSIGLLLCKSRSKVIAEYALKGIEKPIGVSEYQLTKAIPEKLQTGLPTIAEIEAEFNEDE